MTRPRYCWGPSFLEDKVTFRLWAPDARDVLLRLDEEHLPMTRDSSGWYEISTSTPPNKTSYGFDIDGKFRPDPASRGQQADVHGPSVVHLPDTYGWVNRDWKGRDWEEAVIYEIHIGAFTAEGTFRAAIEQLDRLAGLGFTTIEIMPVAQFPGTRGWGYDGVLHYAPHNAYGTPDDFKALVDAAHGRGLMVLLDVVYNHFGPEGNYLGSYATAFFDDERHTPWGAAIDYSNPAPRAYFVENVIYWLEEFRLDGLRFDAVDEIKDEEPHILEEIARRVHGTAFGRKIHLVTENPANGTDLMSPRPDGTKLYRADWNDDFHHAMHVGATGEKGGFYADYQDKPWRQIGRAAGRGLSSLRQAYPR